MHGGERPACLSLKNTQGSPGRWSTGGFLLSFRDPLKICVSAVAPLLVLTGWPPLFKAADRSFLPGLQHQVVWSRSQPALSSRLHSEHWSPESRHPPCSQPFVVDRLEGRGFTAERGGGERCSVHGGQEAEQGAAQGERAGALSSTKARPPHVLWRTLPFRIREGPLNPVQRAQVVSSHGGRPS